MRLIIRVLEIFEMPLIEDMSKKYCKECVQFVSQ